MRSRARAFSLVIDGVDNLRPPHGPCPPSTPQLSAQPHDYASALAITLSERTLAFLAGLRQAHRERLRTWRKLSAREQALRVLAHLRNGDTSARLAAGFDVG